MGKFILRMFRGLYPWQSAFNQLGLERHWWHRLAVVTFFIALAPIFSAFGFLAFMYLRPVYSHMPEIVFSMPTPHRQTQALYDAAVKEIDEARKKGIDLRNL